MNTKTANKISDAQLKTGEQIDKFMSNIPLDLLGEPDFFIEIHREIIWNIHSEPFGKYNLVVPDKNKLRFSVLSAIITKTTYQIHTNTRFYDDNVKTTINSIKDRLEAYFGIIGLIEKIEYFNF